MVRGGIVSAFIDNLQSHLQIERTTSHTHTETGCCHWVSWLMDGTTLPDGSNDNGAEEVSWIMSAWWHEDSGSDNTLSS